MTTDPTGAPAPANVTTDPESTQARLRVRAQELAEFAEARIDNRAADNPSLVAAVLSLRYELAALDQNFTEAVMFLGGVA